MFQSSYKLLNSYVARPLGRILLAIVITIIARALISTSAPRLFNRKATISLAPERVKGICYNYGKLGHFIIDCPKSRKPSIDLKLMKLTELGLVQRIEHKGGFVEVKEISGSDLNSENREL